MEELLRQIVKQNEEILSLLKSSEVADRTMYSRREIAERYGMSVYSVDKLMGREIPIRLGRQNFFTKEQIAKAIKERRGL